MSSAEILGENNARHLLKSVQIPKILIDNMPVNMSDYFIITFYSTPNEYLLYFALVSVWPPCVSPSHGGFMEASTVNSR